MNLFLNVFLKLSAAAEGLGLSNRPLTRKFIELMNEEIKIRTKLLFNLGPVTSISYDSSPNNTRPVTAGLFYSFYSRLLYFNLWLSDSNNFNSRPATSYVSVKKSMPPSRPFSSISAPIMPRAPSEIAVSPSAHVPLSAKLSARAIKGASASHRVRFISDPKSVPNTENISTAAASLGSNSNISSASRENHLEVDHSLFYSAGHNNHNNIFNNHRKQ